jgi:hypothetical protein
MSVYLLHFDRPIGDTSSRYGYAQHYTGSTPDLARRLTEHAANSDVKIMAAVRQAGIGWTLARTWEGGRVRERQLKVQGGASRHCPVCKGHEPQLQDQAAAFTAQPRPARWVKPADPDPEPLEDFIVARLDPAEAAALVDALDAGQRAAWQRTAPGPDYEARFDTACEVARISGQEARAAQRMAEAREIHAAEEAAYQEAVQRTAASQKTPQPEQQEEAGMRGNAWPPWPPQPGADAENTENGGRSRDRAYEAELTTEGRAAFGDRGYLAPGRSDAELARNREQVVSDLGRNLSDAAAARMWQAAYAGVPGMSEYRVPGREMDLEAG